MAIDLSGWTKLIEQIGKELQGGKIKPNDLNPTFLKQTYSELNKSARAGYGKSWDKVHGDNIPNPRISKIKQNLYKFSAAKNAAMLVDINNRLYDGNRLRSFDELREDLDMLNIQYNKNWLEAEYRTARQSGHMAQKWESILQNRDLFPNLKYKTQGDDNVRPEHQELDGIIAPIDSPFWQKYYPPNGWRCRCDAVQTAEKPTKDIPSSVPDVKREFEINIGQSAQVFKEGAKGGHRFFALAKNIPGWQKSFELSKQSAPVELWHKARNSSKVEVSIYADAKDLSENYERAVSISDQLGLNVVIRPDSQLSGWKNPEYLIGNTIADLYRGDPKTGFIHKRKQVKGFIEQYNKTFPEQPVKDKYGIVFDITDIDISYDLSRKINGEFKAGQKLEFIIIFNGQKCVKIDKADSYPAIVKKVSEIANERP